MQFVSYKHIEHIRIKTSPKQTPSLRHSRTGEVRSVGEGKAPSKAHRSCGYYAK